MKITSFFAFSVVSLLCFTAFVAVLPVGSSHIITNSSPSIIKNAYNGTVTIYANGSVSAARAPISHNGNYYNLTGNINGTLVIQHNGTILNGKGYTLFDNSLSGAFQLVTIMNTDSVTISSLTINGTNSLIGIYMEDSSKVLMNNLKINTSYISVNAANHTSDINLSNSVITDSSKMGALGSVLMGVYLTAPTIGFPSLTSHNFSAYNDTFAADFTEGDLLVGSENASISHSKFHDSGILASVLIAGNNTSILGNNFNESGSMAAVESAPYSNGVLHNVNIEGNEITTNQSQPQSAVITSYSTGSISGNVLSINASQQSVTGIISNSGDENITGNSVHITDGGTSANTISGINALGENYTISDNTVNISGGDSSAISMGAAKGAVNNFTISRNFATITAPVAIGLELNFYGSQNTTISHNTFYLNGTLCQGIQFGGVNISVTGNFVDINQTNMSYIYISVGLGSTNVNAYSNVLVSNNEVIMSGTSGYLQTMAVRLLSSKSSNVTVSGNNLQVTQVTVNSHGIETQGIVNLTVSGNDVALNNGDQAFTIMDAYQAVIKDNVVTGAMGSGNTAAGIELYSDKDAEVLNNTFSNFTSAFSTNLVNGLLAAGNYVQNTSSYILSSDGDSNMIFYHNDFMNYSHTILIGSPDSNLSFNSSLPIGGNYWLNYTGTDGNGDGIGDTPYSLITGYSDNYPLMKPWTRPQAVFHEQGLLPGSSWSVTFHGQTKVSSDSTISFDILNGTFQSYNYSISTSKNYKGGGTIGTYDYAGDSFSSSTIYTPYYALNFIETGLPSGTQWFIYINGTSYSTTNSSLSVSLLNGTHVSYSVGGNVLYYPSISGGNFSSLQSNESVDITFTHWSYLNVSIFQNATVLLNGAVLEQNGSGALNETIKAGNYQLVVEESGYTTYYKNFTVAPGQVEQISVNLTKITSPSTSGGLPVQDYYYIGGGVAAAAAVGAATLFLRKRPRA